MSREVVLRQERSDQAPDVDRRDSNSTGGRGAHPASRVKRFARVLRNDPQLTVGLIIVIVDVALIGMAPVVAPYGPTQQFLTAALSPPSVHHWFGTDDTGMDVFSRVLWAPRIDLTIALTATFLAAAIGTPVGVFTGYLRGWLSEAIMRGADIILAFPLFILALALVAARGQSVVNVILVLALVQAPIYVRLMRNETLALRDRQFVDSAICAGNSPTRTFARHVMPNALTPMFIQASVTVGLSILAASGLSFIGAGVPAPTAEWGVMIAVGAPNIVTGQWWPSVFPGIAIGITVLGFALVGEGVKKAYLRGQGG